jgi:predicted O-methyltransferase YrrM
MKSNQQSISIVPFSEDGATCAMPYTGLLQEITSRPAGWQALDVAHAMLAAGLVVSHKPYKILELGIGSAYLTRILLAALQCNGRGELMSVDNFFDWHGVKPDHVVDLETEFPHWKVVVRDETAYLSEAIAEGFDMIVSDGDHTRGYQNAPDVFRVCRPGGIMLFHDTNCVLYGLLRRLPRRVKSLGFSTLHFVDESRTDEKTGRGLLVVCNDRKRAMTVDWPVRFYLLCRHYLPASCMTIIKKLLRTERNR